MTILGEDKPGLVESVASIITEHGGNWMESRMCHLGGQFAGILHILVPEEKERALKEAVYALENKGLNIVVHADGQEEKEEDIRMAQIEIVGQDRPGIVREISRGLASYGVNVEELSSGCRDAPMSGEVIFEAKARLKVPVDCRLEDLRAGLEKIAGDLMVDLSFEQS